MIGKRVLNILFSNDERYGGTVVAALELAKACQCKIDQEFIIGPMLEETGYIIKSDIEFHSTSWINFLGFSFMPKMVKVLDKLKTKIGIIHINGVWNLYNIQVLNWARKNKVPVVWTVHGELDPFHLRSKRFKKSIFLLLFLRTYKKYVSKVRVITQREKQIIMDMGFKQPVRMIPNGISKFVLDSNLTKSLCRNIIGIGKDCKVLLYASRLSPEKGIDRLVAVFNEISKEIPEWQLIIAGSEVGAPPSFLKNIRDNIKLNNRIQYIGHWPSKKKEVLYRAADCFILPSFAEGFSMSILEASCFSIPSIITSGCNFPELAMNGGAFALSHKNMCEELIDILKNPIDVFERMGTLAQDFVNKDYTWDKIGKTMVREYEKLLDAV